MSRTRPLARAQAIASQLTFSTQPGIRQFTTTTSAAGQPTTTATMTKPHPLTMIPGPIEFDDAVLEAMSHPAQAHTAPAFISVFSEALKWTRNLFGSTKPESQPFILAGSGSLGWDIVGANFIERGDNALVLNTGYFSSAFADALNVYGANVDQLTAAIGDRPTDAEIEAALKQKKYKVITITHVDTSTGVLSDVKAIAGLVRQVSPETLVIVDGVCSVGSEELEFDAWDLDYVLTGSQKAIGAPPGLSISFASARAIKTVESRKTPVASYFAALPRWIPIMNAYESKKPAYFATPAVQNVHALHASLAQFATSIDSVRARIATHAKVSDSVKDKIESLGLKTVAVSRQVGAHGMTAIYLPPGVANPDLLPLLLKKNVVLAGGIHKEIATKYFRLGHMGISVTKPELGHIDTALNAIESSLGELGYKQVQA